MCNILKGIALLFCERGGVNTFKIIGVLSEHLIWQPGTVCSHTVCTGECFHIVDEDGANEGSSYYFGKHIRTILICCFDFFVLTEKRFKATEDRCASWHAGEQQRVRNSEDCRLCRSRWGGKSKLQVHQSCAGE